MPALGSRLRGSPSRGRPDPRRGGRALKFKDMLPLLLLLNQVQLCDPMDCSPAGFSVHRIFQARILE